ncbi:hypothetical protein AMTR_s00052p00112830 [Amborella trichopoda]|uniref:Uncharacterized protein n=1 Tax=Amborella trichopoda TaxID=13333 RepID=U5D1T6_AMBTC|nr:hypothetical protein AMTR_s00052p00112830 [Amborella trichopoda]
MKTIFEWETQLNWGHLSLKTPSQVATPQHLQRGLVLASSIGLPQEVGGQGEERETADIHESGFHGGGSRC